MLRDIEKNNQNLKKSTTDLEQQENELLYNAELKKVLQENTLLYQNEINKLDTTSPETNFPILNNILNKLADKYYNLEKNLENTIKSLEEEKKMLVEYAQHQAAVIKHQELEEYLQKNQSEAFNNITEKVQQYIKNEIYLRKQQQELMQQIQQQQQQELMQQINDPKLDPQQKKSKIQQIKALQKTKKEKNRELKKTMNSILYTLPKKTQTELSIVEEEYTQENKPNIFQTSQESSQEIQQKEIPRRKK